MLPRLVVSMTSFFGGADGRGMIPYKDRDDCACGAKARPGRRLCAACKHDAVGCGGGTGATVGEVVREREGARSAPELHDQIQILRGLI